MIGDSSRARIFSWELMNNLNDIPAIGFSQQNSIRQVLESDVSYTNQG